MFTKCIITPILPGISPAQLTDAWDAFNRDMSNSLFETGEARVDFTDLSLLSLYQLLDDLWEEPETVMTCIDIPECFCKIRAMKQAKHLLERTGRYAARNLLPGQFIAQPSSRAASRCKEKVEKAGRQADKS